MKGLPDVISIQPDIHGSGIYAFGHSWDRANVLEMRAKVSCYRKKNALEPILIEIIQLILCSSFVQVCCVACVRLKTSVLNINNSKLAFATG